MDSGGSFRIRSNSSNRVSLFMCTYGTTHKILVSSKSASATVAALLVVVVTIAFKSVDVSNVIVSIEKKRGGEKRGEKWRDTNRLFLDTSLC